MILLDLHGFVNPMLIEPCTSPHNPNYEYDLYIKWALKEAEAMRTAVEANTPFRADIPYLDYKEGWDDYPPICAPMYAIISGPSDTPWRRRRSRTTAWLPTTV